MDHRPAVVQVAKVNLDVTDPALITATAYLQAPKGLAFLRIDAPSAEQILAVKKLQHVGIIDCTADHLKALTAFSADGHDAPTDVQINTWVQVRSGAERSAVVQLAKVKLAMDQDEIKAVVCFNARQRNYDPSVDEIKAVKQLTKVGISNNKREYIDTTIELLKNKPDPTANEIYAVVARKAFSDAGYLGTTADEIDAWVKVSEEYRPTVVQVARVKLDVKDKDFILAAYHLANRFGGLVNDLKANEIKAVKHLLKLNCKSYTKEEVNATIHIQTNASVKCGGIAEPKTDQIEAVRALLFYKC